MDKSILKEYGMMKVELEDIRKRAERLEHQLESYREQYHVSDSVSGGCGGKKHFKVDGFPYPEYNNRRTILMQRKVRMQQLQKILEEKISDVESYIEGVENSRMRSILRMRYIDSMTWRQIARKFGEGYSSDAIRMEHDRFMGTRDRRRGQ